MKRSYETVDGRRFETLERAMNHARTMLGSSVPEYVWQYGTPCYVLFPDGTQGYASSPIVQRALREEFGL